MSDETQNQEILLVAEKVGEVCERLEKLEENHAASIAPVEAAKTVLEAAIEGIQALKSRVLEQDIARLEARFKDSEDFASRSASEIRAVVSAHEIYVKENFARIEEMVSSVSSSIAELSSALRAQIQRVEMSVPKREEFAVPLKGDPGLPGDSITPVDDYFPGMPVPKLAMVRVNNRVWISKKATSETPSNDSSDWMLLMSNRVIGGGGSGLDLGAMAFRNRVEMPTATSARGGVGDYAVSGDQMAAYVDGVGFVFFTAYQK